MTRSTKERVAAMATEIVTAWYARLAPEDLDPVNDEGARESRRLAAIAHRVALAAVQHLEMNERALPEMTAETPGAPIAAPRPAPTARSQKASRAAELSPLLGRRGSR